MYDSRPTSRRAGTAPLLTLLLFLMASGAFASADAPAPGTGLRTQARAWDTNGDGKLDDAEKQALRDAMIERWDADGDGRLNRAERAKGRTSGDLPPMPEKRWQRALAARRHAAQRAADQAAQQKARIEAFDQDGDNKLSKKEVWEGINRPQAERQLERRREILENYDVDGDGTLDAEERRRYRRANNLVTREEVDRLVPKDEPKESPNNEPNSAPNNEPEPAD